MKERTKERRRRENDLIRSCSNRIRCQETITSSTLVGGYRSIAHALYLGTWSVSKSPTLFYKFSFESPDLVVSVRRDSGMSRT